MRRPDVVVAPLSHSSSVAQTSPVRSSSSISIRGRVRSSISSFAPPPAADGGSGGWTLPPLNQFMTLPGRFLASRFGDSVDSSVDSSSDGVVRINRNRNLVGALTNGATLDNLLNGEDEDEEWATHDHLMLPHMAHFQDIYEPSNAATGPTHQPEEIDLTVSSSEDESGGQNAAGTAGDSDDIIEIIEPSQTSGAPQPAPLRRKRRRPAPGAAANGDAVLVPKRQRSTDMMRSAESTNVSIHNNEVVQEFKHLLKCSICLDVLEDMTSTLCGHVFCAGCIHRAIHANGKCPLCQRRLHPKDTHRLFL